MLTWWQVTLWVIACPCACVFWCMSVWCSDPQIREKRLNWPVFSPARLSNAAPADFLWTIWIGLDQSNERARAAGLATCHGLTVLSRLSCPVQPVWLCYCVWEWVCVQALAECQPWGFSHKGTNRFSRVIQQTQWKSEFDKQSAGNFSALKPNALFGN